MKIYEMSCGARAIAKEMKIELLNSRQRRLR